MHKHLARRLAPLLLAGVGLACGAQSASTRGTASGAQTGPHGGVAVPLPDNQGFGEVVIEPAAARKEDSEVAVYFLKADLQSPLSPLPSDVRVKLQLPSRDPADLVLSPKPKSNDPAGTGRFASAAGPYAVDQAIGELTASVGGRSVTIPFRSPR